MISASTLRTAGCVYMSYPPELRAAVATAINDWQRFCAIPNETKIAFPYELLPDGKTVSGVGYELKVEKGNTLDHKEDFHLRSHAKDLLLRHAHTFDDPAAAEFVESALLLPALIKPLLIQFAEAMEREFGLTGFADDVRSPDTDLLLRFLHYFGECEPGETLAAPHIDKSGFTLHLYESDSGVERLGFNGTWSPIPLSHDETIVFPALGLQKRSGNQAKALYHRVVATEETARQGRYSAVCFVIPRGTPGIRQRASRQAPGPASGLQLPADRPAAGRSVQKITKNSSPLTGAHFFSLGALVSLRHDHGRTGDMAGAFKRY